MTVLCSIGANLVTIVNRCFLTVLTTLTVLNQKLFPSTCLIPESPDFFLNPLLFVFWAEVVRLVVMLMCAVVTHAHSDFTSIHFKRVLCVCSLNFWLFVSARRPRNVSCFWGDNQRLLVFT